MLRKAILLGALSAASFFTACRPEIGDQCVLGTDCSVRGDRQCDTAQPGGYCTQFNCRKDTCPDEASCILFNSAIPGCAYDDRSGGFGSRVSRSFCERRCESQGDCRGGYVCVKPQSFPWNAVNLDDDQVPMVCLPVPPLGLDGGNTPSTAPVCSSVGPPTSPIDASPAQIFEAGVTPAIDAGAQDAGPQDAGDGG